MLVGYITYRMKEKFEARSNEENEATYLRMKIAKADNGEFEGVTLDSNNYEGRSIILEFLTNERGRQTNRRRKTNNRFCGRNSES